jgi:ribosomal protein S27AE
MIIVIKLTKGSEHKYYPIYIHHSSTSATINLESQFRRTAKNYKVPLIAHGHTHRIFWKDNTSFSVSYINGDFYRSILRQYWLSTGCFIKYAGYAEARSMGPPDIKAPLVRFHFSKDVLEYKDPTTQWIDLHDTDEAIKSWISETGKINVEVTLQRPSCPRCGSDYTISRGTEWQCGECHRRWKKVYKQRE